MLIEFQKLVIEFLALAVRQLIAARTILRANHRADGSLFNRRFLAFHDVAIAVGAEVSKRQNWAASSLRTRVTVFPGSIGCVFRRFRTLIPIQFGHCSAKRRTGVRFKPDSVPIESGQRSEVFGQLICRPEWRCGVGFKMNPLGGRRCTALSCRLARSNWST